MRRILPLLLAMAGCAASQPAPPPGPVKPDPGQAAIDACRNYVCPPRPEVTLQNRCMAGQVDKYGKLPDAAARREFLVNAGCPVSVIDGSLAVPGPAR